MKRIIPTIALCLTACQRTSIPEPPSDFKPVAIYAWEGKTPYPFVELNGELSCVSGAVYFTPGSKINDDNATYPLNEAAVKVLGKKDLSKVVQANANLEDAVNQGLVICRKVDEYIKRQKD